MEKAFIDWTDHSKRPKIDGYYNFWGWFNVDGQVELKKFQSKVINGQKSNPLLLGCTCKRVELIKTVYWVDDSVLGVPKTLEVCKN